MFRKSSQVSPDNLKKGMVVEASRRLNNSAQKYRGMRALQYVSERMSLTSDLKHLQFCCTHNAIAETTLLCESYHQVPIDLLGSYILGPHVSLLASPCQGSPAPYRRIHGCWVSACSPPKSRSHQLCQRPFRLQRYFSMPLHYAEQLQ